MNSPVEFDPYDYATQDDPFPGYKALRDHAPVYRSRKHGFWLLSRYDDVLAAVRDAKTFSSRIITLEPLTDEELPPLVITSDPPDHGRLRHLIAPMLTPAAVAPLGEDIRQLTRRLLAPLLPSGRMDAIVDFAQRLPMAMMCRLLGVPMEDEDDLRRWTDMAVDRKDGVFTTTEENNLANQSIYRYFETQYQQRLADPAPRDDLLGRLMAAEKEGRISHEEFLGFGYMLALAGSETTRKLLGNMIYYLWKFKDQWKLLQQDPSLLGSAIEETVRYNGPTHMMGRLVTTDITLHGQTLKRGDKVGVLLMSGNRDERKYTNPDVYDIRRNPRDHLGFGGGLHACVGAALARLEVKIAIQELLHAIDDYHVIESACTRTHSPQVRGFANLPIEFTLRT
ncbi:MAG: cytochrome P450 [Proteobacteria bacterium]|nr:cytochrome P450 [Pseudomonadota bacterium]HQR02725.1 cytochrome P450 [Rhodocyclaceae bacterium]